MIGKIVFVSLLLSVQIFAQPSTDKFAVFDGKGNAASVSEIVKALQNADVVFLGEQHDDAVGHAVQLEIFRQINEKFAAKRKVALSLEMFERDVQVVLNEYLAGLISENHFLLSSRPWANYKSDYRPLVELAKEKHFEVIAANAPRRYVNMVSRNGRDSLNALSPEAKKWLALLPYAEPSEAYSKKFKSLMGKSPEAQGGIDKILASQSLWDATMAYSIAENLKKNKGAIIVHLNGAFHTESRLGTVEHLLKYRPKTRVVVVTIRYEDDFKTFDKSKHTDIGDFVILTAPKMKIQGKLPEILRRMNNYYQSLHTLKADVTMVKYNSQLKESDTYIGSASYLPKTGNSGIYLCIDWTKPVEEHFAMIGYKYAVYLPRLNQVIIGNVENGKTDPSVSKALSLMNVSSDQFKANYEIEYIGEEQISGNVKTWHLKVSPKAITNYKNAEIWVDCDGVPRQFKINEQHDDSTTVLLSNIQTNIKIEGETFRLKYPSSVKQSIL